MHDSHVYLGQIAFWIDNQSVKKTAAFDKIENFELSLFPHENSIILSLLILGKVGSF
jgi:hypothetical protein